MAYFPEYYGGELWGQAIAGVGQDIGQAMQFYAQRHQQMDQMDQTFQALSQMQHPDGKPYIDKKAWERISHLTGTEKAKAEGGYLAAMGFANKLNQYSRDAAYGELQMQGLRRKQQLAGLEGKPYFRNGMQVGTYGPDGKVIMDPAYLHPKPPKEKEEDKPLPAPPPKKGIIQRAEEFFMGEKQQPQQPVAQSPAIQAQRDKAIAILKKNNKPVSEANIQWVIKQLGGGGG